MKTCKDNIFFEAKTAGEYPKNWMVVPALDVGRYLKQNYVPLSEFEAYKQKTKQAIDGLIEDIEVWDKTEKTLGTLTKTDVYFIDKLEKLKKELEL